MKKPLTKLALVLDKIAVVSDVQRRKSLQRMEVNMSRKINEAEKSLNPDTLNLNEDQKQELYFLEHVLLPNIFYDMGLQFLNTLVSEGGEILLDTLSSIHKENPSYRCSYSAADFAVTSFADKERDIIIQRVQMPKPKVALLCSCIYFVYSSDFEKHQMYTVELSESGDYFLCGWCDIDTHMIVDVLEQGSEDVDIEMIIELFLSE